MNPFNSTYSEVDVWLNYTIDEITSWIGYSLDGAPNITITENILLKRFTEGSHHIALYTNDSARKMDYLKL
jgi:hypothetical protein